MLSANEMLSALGLRGGPPFLVNALSLPLLAASRRLGESLAALDTDIEPRGLPAAADRALTRCGVSLRCSGTPVPDGPCLVLANHPGAYDALSLMRAVARPDLAILAADRRFLRALRGLSAHLIFVGDVASGRAGALKRALGWLQGGGALLHFPAGCIEPDPDFVTSSVSPLARWQPGVAALVRACLRVSGRVWLAGVRGVHSPRAKRLLLNRLAERRGVTTLSPLLQLLARLNDVQVRVHLAEGPPELGLLPPEARERALMQALISALRAT